MVPSVYGGTHCNNTLRPGASLYGLRTNYRDIPRGTTHARSSRHGTCYCMHARVKTHRTKTLPLQTKVRGFTLLELLVVISIIGILATLVYPSVLASRKQAYVTKTKAEFRSIATAVELYSNNIGGYPPDVSRNLPAGIETYLAPGNWPAAPWPGSVYDWDNWAPANLDYAPFAQVYHISVRFCPLNEPGECQFPNEPWAANFDYYSSAYYCISGPCRSHSDRPTSHPGYCINC